MVRGNPLLRAHVAEYRTLVFVISPHACFLSAAPVHRHRQTRYCTTFSAACSAAPQMPASLTTLSFSPTFVIPRSEAPLSFRGAKRRGTCCPPAAPLLPG